MSKLVFFHNASFFLYKQRHIYSKFRELGHEVFLLCPNTDKYFAIMQNEDYQVIEIFFQTKTLNLFHNLALVFKIKKIFHAIQPDIVFSFSIKPNLYSAVAAKFTKIQVVPNVTGLGYVFMQEGFLTWLVIRMYRIAFKSVKIVFLQNHDDAVLLTSRGAINSIQTKIIVLPGDGVDLNQFYNVGLQEREVVRFIFASRLLWGKGIRELLEAFERVQSKYSNTSLTVIGGYYLDNPSAVTEEFMTPFIKCGLINYLGHVDNVSEILSEYDCMVLPSYREGMARVLMEASSMGKPCITVNTPGCRDIVEHNVTGFIAQPRNVESLTQAMCQFVELSFADKCLMGQAARKKMETQFDQNIIVKSYLSVFNQVVGSVL